MARFCETHQIVPVIEPLDLDTDRTGDWVNLENYGKVVFIFTKGVGTAGDDFNFTVQQATNNAAGSAKDCDAIDVYWIKQAATNLTGTGTFTATTQTADALISGNATSAEQAALLVCEVNAEQLDLANGFTHVNASVTLDASGGAQYGAVMAILCDPRYPQATQLTAID